MAGQLEDGINHIADDDPAAALLRVTHDTVDILDAFVCEAGAGIGELLDLIINQLASQTNLLAPNATFEAARGEEAGGRSDSRAHSTSLPVAAWRNRRATIVPSRGTGARGVGFACTLSTAR